MNTKRVYFDVASVVAILGITGGFFWGALVLHQRSQAVEESVEVETELELTTVACIRLVPHDIKSCLQRRGTVKPGARVEVVAEQTVRVDWRRVQVGDHVESGDELFVLDAAKAKIQVDAAEAELSSAKALLDEAIAELNSARELDDEDLENQTKARRDAAEASVRLAETRLAEAERSQRQCQITAPISGVIAQSYVDEGEFASEGRPVAEIVSVDPVQVVVTLTARELKELERATADWQVLLDGDVFDAEVKFTSPVADTVTKRFDQVLEVGNEKGRLMLGAKVDVVCQWKGQRETLTMPRRAILMRKFGPICYRIESDGQKAICRKTPVRFASIPGSPELVKVLEGLRANDRVAIERLLNLRDGAEVQVEQ